MKRFSLKTLLVAATLLAVFVGYAQQRRRTILQECEALKAERVRFTLPDDWPDRIWQRTPSNVIVIADMQGGLHPADQPARQRLDALGWKYQVLGPPTEVK